MNTPVVGNCPICSGQIELVHTETKDARDIAIDKANESILYKGAGYLLVGSVSVLCAMNGIPFGTKIGAAAKEAIEMASANIAVALSDAPSKIYFFEIRCKNCHFVLKRYCTQNIN